MCAAKNIPDDPAFLVVAAAASEHDWEHLEAIFGRRPFTLKHVAGEIPQVLSECRKLTPCTLLGEYDFFMNPARQSEFSRFLQFEKSVSVLMVLREEKRDEILGPLLRMGCMGFVSASLPAEQLRRAVRAVRAGEIWAPRRLVSAVLQDRYGGPRSLTAREWEILSLVAQGLSNRAISDVLQIAHETVRWNMRMIYKKLDVHDRKSVVLCAFGTGGRKAAAASTGNTINGSKLAS